MTFVTKLFSFIIHCFLFFIIISCTSAGDKLSSRPFDQGEEEEYDEDEESEEESIDSYATTDNVDTDSVMDDEDYDDEEYDDEESDDDYMVSDTTNFIDASPTTPKKTWVPLKKIPRTTWKHDGKWINAVYIARSGESLNQINLKIYGNNDKQDELKSINPLLQRRAPKVGDKIYYNSPMRPMDRNKFLFYYEDINRTPSSFDINKGENIRAVSQKLLGHVDSWKEIWATNEQVESKGVLDQRVSILYWPDSASVASSPPPMPEPEMMPEPDMMPPMPEPEMVPEEVPVADMPPMPEPEMMPEEVPVADMPPMPEPDMMPEEMPEPVMAENEIIYDEDDIAPLPEEPPISMDDSPVSGDVQGKKKLLDLSDWKVKGGLIALVFVVIALWFARLIRNRKNRPDFDFSQTNVDIDNIEE